MRRRAALYFVGSVALIALAGCGRGWVAFEQRDPWRSEAEAACVKSGAVKTGSTLVPMRPIEGPGVCGARYPFKVAALGDRTLLGYMRDMRPPGEVPTGFPIPEPRRPAPPRTEAQPVQYGGEARVGSAQAGYGAGPGYREAAPLSLRAPGIEGADEDDGDLPEEAGNGTVDDDPRQYDAAPGAPERLGPQAAPLTVGSAAVKPEATLACPLVARLDQWMAQSVQPAAMRWFGQPVAEIRQISAYSCRGMNGQRGAPISEHAFGNALDIAAFTLADGRRVTVKNGWHGSPEEQGFLRDVHAAACEQFSTVLAPGSNRFHYDHIHVDLARRRSGRRYCNPRPIPGDVIARRAAGRTVTGSVGRSGRMGFAEEQPPQGFPAQLPRAVPGAD
jgi:hypothetical protein